MTVLQSDLVHRIKPAEKLYERHSICGSSTCGCNMMLDAVAKHRFHTCLSCAGPGAALRGPCRADEGPDVQDMLATSPWSGIAM